jgi:hypothetical protein
MGNENDNLFGDADVIIEFAQGSNDELTGGDNIGTGRAAVEISQKYHPQPQKEISNAKV